MFSEVSITAATYALSCAAGSAALSAVSAKVSGSQNVKGSAIYSAVSTLTEAAMLITGVVLPVIHLLNLVCGPLLEDNQTFEALACALVGGAILCTTSAVVIPAALFGGFLAGKAAAWLTGNNVPMSEVGDLFRIGQLSVLTGALFALTVANGSM